MQENPLLSWIKENLLNERGFFALIFTALTPILGKALIDRWSGKHKIDQETSTGALVQSLVTSTRESAELSAKIVDETVQLYEARLADEKERHRLDLAAAESRYKLLVTESEKIRRTDKKEYERIIRQLTSAKETVERQNEKLRKQYEQVRAEAEAWRNQIINQYEGTPVEVPILK